MASLGARWYENVQPFPPLLTHFPDLRGIICQFICVYTSMLFVQMENNDFLGAPSCLNLSQRQYRAFDWQLCPKEHQSYGRAYVILNNCHFTWKTIIRIRTLIIHFEYTQKITIFVPLTKIWTLHKEQTCCSVLICYLKTKWYI